MSKFEYRYLSWLVIAKLTCIGHFYTCQPHGYMSPLTLSYIRTAFDAVNKASVIRVKGLEVLGKARTGCLVNVFCRLQNAVS